MKGKIIISTLVVILAITFFSFKVGEKESCSSAVVNVVFGKENEGFLIHYGDGTVELKQFEFKRNNENYIKSTSMVAQIINEMHAKGYHYSGMGAHSGNDLGMVLSYLVFEKK